MCTKAVITRVSACRRLDLYCGTQVCVCARRVLHRCVCFAQVCMCVLHMSVHVCSAQVCVLHRSVCACVCVLHRCACVCFAQLCVCVFCTGLCVHVCVLCTGVHVPGWVLLEAGGGGQAFRLSQARALQGQSPRGSEVMFPQTSSCQTLSALIPEVFFLFPLKKTKETHTF